MKNKLTAYMPFWFLLMVPPLLLLLLGFNFIMCVFGIIITLFILNISDGFTKYSKNIFKLWGISIVVDIITFIVLFIPEFFSSFEFINTNLVYPIEHNPYSKVLSFIYMFLLGIIIIFITYKLIKKYIFKNVSDNNKRKIANIVLTAFILPYLLFVPSSLLIKAEKSTLEDFKGTLMGNKSDIVVIMKNINVSEYINSYVLDTHKEPYTIKLYLKTIDMNYIKDFEIDAASIFALVDDVNEVVFYMDDTIYGYTINRINKIYGDIKKDGLAAIKTRYSNELFSKYIYLDHIDEYDLFDTSEVCEETPQELFTYEYAKYYLVCNSLDNIILYDSDDNSMTLKEALENKKISEEDLINSFLNIKTDIELYEDSN